MHPDITNTLQDIRMHHERKYGAWRSESIAVACAFLSGLIGCTAVYYAEYLPHYMLAIAFVVWILLVLGCMWAMDATYVRFCDELPSFNNSHEPWLILLTLILVVSFGSVFGTRIGGMQLIAGGPLTFILSIFAAHASLVIVGMAMRRIARALSLLLHPGGSMMKPNSSMPLE